MSIHAPYQPYVADVETQALENTDFRRVINTTERSQLVLMCVPAGGEIGQETHGDTDQILYFVDGEGEAVFANARHGIGAGDAVVVPAGTQHNFLANAGEPLKLFTIYTPPHHRPGTVHATKADADADTADHYSV